MELFITSKYYRIVQNITYIESTTKPLIWSSKFFAHVTQAHSPRVTLQSRFPVCKRYSTHSLHVRLCHVQVTASQSQGVRFASSPGRNCVLGHGTPSWVGRSLGVCNWSLVYKNCNQPMWSRDKVWKHIDGLVSIPAVPTITVVSLVIEKTTTRRAPRKTWDKYLLVRSSRTHTLYQRSGIGVRHYGGSVLYLSDNTCCR